MPHDLKCTLFTESMGQRLLVANLISILIIFLTNKTIILAFLAARSSIRGNALTGKIFVSVHSVVVRNKKENSCNTFRTVSDTCYSINKCHLLLETLTMFYFLLLLSYESLVLWLQRFYNIKVLRLE